jgi:hypothetical protein
MLIGLSNEEIKTLAYYCRDYFTISFTVLRLLLYDDVMAAPKGNKFAEGNTGGRPPMFQSAEELQGAIDEYFNTGLHQKTIIVGKGTNKQSVVIGIPTITGLCHYIGFESRQSFYDLEKTEEFTYTVKRARLFIEMEYEEQLQVGNTIGAIFALKNMGWFDRKELTGAEGKDLMPARILTKEEAASYILKLENEL